jgi:hypothetical protein
MASSTGAEGAPATGASAGAGEAHSDAGSPPASSAGSDQRGEAARKTGELSGSVAGSINTSERASCLLNAHYHAAREGFLDTTHRWFMLGIIIFGASAFADLIPQAAGSGWLKGSFGAGAALLGGLDLTFDLSNRARSHALMKRRYFELLADMRDGLKTSEQVLSCLDRFSAEEEPPYRVLLLMCRNRAQSEVRGSGARLFRIPRRHRFIKNIFRMSSVDYGPPLLPSERKGFWSRMCTKFSKSGAAASG